MAFRIIKAGTRSAPTKGSIKYSSPNGDFFVRKAELKERGFKEAPEKVFQIVTDELPEGWEVAEESVVTFEL